MRAISTVPVPTIADLLRQLGVPARRVLLKPTPGQATEKDLLRYKGTLVELIDGVLVEKAMGWYESLLGFIIAYHQYTYNRKHKLGIVLTEQGLMRVAPGQLRMPDVAFYSWAHFPGHKLPRGQILDAVPDLAIEVLSPGNTPKEMRRKRREFFAGGATLVWEVDPKRRRVTVYTSPTDATILGEQDTLSGDPVFPSFALRIADLFAEAGERA
jgi:Uma2 family endonuclease